MKRLASLLGLQAVFFPDMGSGATCPTVLTPTGYGKPVVGGGWTAQLVVTGLTRPRSLQFDSAGNLLVLEASKGVSRITFDDHGGTCLVRKDYATVLSLSELNHGIALSPDGKTLYVSSADAVFSYPYDAGSTSGNFVSRGSARKLIGGMRNSDHITRTLLVAQRFSKGQLLVSRGSADNIDAEARILSSGHSQLKLFDLSALPSGGGNESAFDFTRDGKILAWGLRNSVGVAEEPTTGGIFTVENSADELRRDGVDIHQNNPGEELNFHGFLNGSETAGVGGNPPNYGYPDCFAMWDTQAVPNAANRTVGSQFPVSQSESLNDAICNRDFVAPRLTFAAHMAPLDIKFTSDGSEAYISFHGSWNRDSPIGYKLSVVSFSGGQPTEPPTSTTATKDILSNADLSACPRSCFRPCGIAVDSKGRVFVTSDATGDIFVLAKSDLTATGDGTLVSGDRDSNAASGLRLATTDGWERAIVIALAAALPTVLLWIGWL